LLDTLNPALAGLLCRQPPYPLAVQYNGIPPPDGLATGAASSPSRARRDANQPVTGGLAVAQALKAWAREYGQRGFLSGWIERPCSFGKSGDLTSPRGSVRQEHVIALEENLAAACARLLREHRPIVAEGN